jgi:hypothetical protein
MIFLMNTCLKFCISDKKSPIYLGLWSLVLIKKNNKILKKQSFLSYKEAE